MDPAIQARRRMEKLIMRSTVLASPSLPDIVYQKLRTDILRGDLKPGQLLRQEELARRYSVSRVPLREAMSRLEADGLVVLRPRRGYAVTSLDPHEIVEVFELRMVVEEHAGFIAARARTETDVVEVGLLLKEMEKLDPRSPTYLSDWAQLNNAFHARLIGSSRRQRLTRIASTLQDTVEPCVVLEAGMTGDVAAANREHREIFEALRAGDAQSLGELSRRHVEDTFRRLLAGMRRDASNAS
jgi:DNA-binding GntR family transcriptional regulator